MALSSIADTSMSGVKMISGMKNLILEGLVDLANGNLLEGIRKITKKPQS